MESLNSERFILEEIGSHLSQYRLNRNMTQAFLAKEAGVSKRTIIRLEDGQSVQLSTLIKILRQLDLLQNMDALIPKPAISPIQQIKVRGRSRQRASNNKVQEEKKKWLWGNDE